MEPDSYLGAAVAKANEHRDRACTCAYCDEAELFWHDMPVEHLPTHLAPWWRDNDLPGVPHD